MNSPSKSPFKARAPFCALFAALLPVVLYVLLASRPSFLFRRPPTEFGLQDAFLVLPFVATVTVVGLLVAVTALLRRERWPLLAWGGLALNGFGVWHSVPFFFGW